MIQNLPLRLNYKQLNLDICSTGWEQGQRVCLRFLGKSPNPDIPIQKRMLLFLKCDKTLRVDAKFWF